MEEKENPNPWDVNIDLPPDKEYELICFKKKQFNEKMDELIRVANELQKRENSMHAEYLLKELKKLGEGNL